jgi:hypothetical protein
METGSGRVTEGDDTETLVEPRRHVFSKYQMAGPTIAKFHWSDAKVRGIRGPVGSGKSVACCVEICLRACRQQPNAAGVRRTRWAIVRNTYPELWTTTIKTWQEWFPEAICPIRRSPYIEGLLRFLLPDGTLVEAEIIFLSLDRAADEKKLLSLELTGVWINEARELGVALVNAAVSRTGRYPPKRDGVPITWTGLIMDTNSPDTDHWWYRFAEQAAWRIEADIRDEDGNKIEGAAWEFFSQPGALRVKTDAKGKILNYEPNPEAENVQNQQLGFGYWYGNLNGKKSGWIKAMILGQYAPTEAGKPVYGDLFREDWHVAKSPLAILPNVPVRLGWDFGLTPACIIGQLAPNGQFRILRELVCTRGGLRQFVADSVNPALKNEFAGLPIVSHGDPAGAQAQQVDDTLTCLSELRKMGIPTEPAPGGNDLAIRIGAVQNWLSRVVANGEPGMILDPSVQLLRKGFISGYRLVQVQIAGPEVRYRDVPEKNQYSHPHDGLQYLALGTENVAKRPGDAAVQPNQVQFVTVSNTKWRGF